MLVVATWPMGHKARFTHRHFAVFVVVPVDACWNIVVLVIVGTVWV